MNLKKSKRVLVVANLLVFFVMFQLLMSEREKSFKKSGHSDSTMIGPDVKGSVKKVSVGPDESTGLRCLSKKECDELVNSCEPHLKSIVITALNTGMKKIELLNLQWENVDIEHGLIMLDRATKSERMIPLNDTLKKTLRNIARRHDVPYVFYNKTTGKPYRNISKSFTNALRRANIKDCHFGDLRNTFASQLIMEGVDMKKVMKLLGHKTLKTASRYLHLAKSNTV